MALMHWVIPVEIVHLELHELDFGMLAQHGVERIGAVVDGKPEMANDALLALASRELPHVEAVKRLGAHASQVVHEVVVDVVGACALERGLELGVRLLGVIAFEPGGGFGGEQERIARIALDQRLARGLLASRIGPGRVEVVEAGIEEGVDHVAELWDVDLAIDLRQAHEAKAQLTVDVVKAGHQNTPQSR